MRLAAAAATGVALACAFVTTGVLAQQVPEAPAQAAPTQTAPTQTAPAKGAKGKAQPAQKADPASAERALETSIKYYESGKTDQAIQAINMVLQSGGLPSSKMARALHYRGLAYKKSGKPAQAIADLTSALWLKGGLAPSERTEALAQRAAAYREAGLGEPPAIDAGGSKATAAAPSSEPAARPASSAATAAPAPAPAQSAATEAPASSGGIGGFFSNIGSMFGSGPAQAEAPPPPQGVAAPAATGSVHAPPPPAVSSWSETKVSAAAPAKVAAAAPAAAAPARAPAAAVAPAAAPAAVPAAEAGRFRLQVAAVRTRAEAEAIAAKVKREFAKKLASHQAVINSAAVGDMGTFYRVRVGPYANANEPRQLCISMRAAGGYDCMVVTQ